MSSKQIPESLGVLGPGEIRNPCALLANASAAPQVEKEKETKSPGDDRLKIFQELPGVGDATAQALADAGYGTIGDIIADSAEEDAQKTGLSLGVARTVQMAADRYLQS